MYLAGYWLNSRTTSTTWPIASHTYVLNYRGEILDDDRSDGRLYPYSSTFAFARLLSGRSGPTFYLTTLSSQPLAALYF
jgi:hypothetical protein